MRISVIIPTLNAERTLSACLTSVLAQNFRDLEVLVIDGGSGDATLTIVERFARKFDDLYYWSAPDAGIYDAMNKGVRYSTGDWLYFLGSDDELYSPHVFEEMFVKDTQHIDVLYGNVFDEATGKTYDGEFTADKLLYKNICHQAILVRRKVFELTGPFSLRYKAHADWEFNLKCFGSDRISVQYLPVTIAKFAAGGLSSYFKDPAFERLLHWEKLRSGKKRVRRLDRARTLKAMIFATIRHKEYSLLLKVISGSFSYVI